MWELTLMNFWKIDSRDKVRQILNNLGDNLIEKWDFTKPVRIETKPYNEKQTRSQRALMHIWFRDIAKHFEKSGFMYDVNSQNDKPAEYKPLSEDDVKLMLKKLYLGTEDIVRGKFTLEGQLRRTSNLDIGEQTVFLDEIYYWGHEKGIDLKIPAESDYMKYKGMNNGKD